MLTTIPAFDDSLKEGSIVQAEGYIGNSTEAYTKNITVTSVAKNRTSFTGFYFNPKGLDTQVQNRFDKYISDITINADEVSKGIIKLTKLVPEQVPVEEAFVSGS